MKKLIFLCVIFLLFPVLVTGVWLLIPSPEGFLRIAQPGISLGLDGGWWIKYKVRSDDNPMAIPARTYRPRLLSICHTQGSSRWYIVSTGPWGDLRSIRIEPDKTTSLVCGSPFIIKADVQRAGRVLYIKPLIIGKAGEHYRNITRSGKRMIPTFQIMDEKEHILATAQFEYG